MRLKFTLLSLFLLPFTNIFSQVAGCKDPMASNYNASATINNGSCIYNITNYTPTIKVAQLNSLLAETSGLLWDGTGLWTLNDGGGTASIFKIDTSSNAILQTVTLAGTTNIDWEDIAFDGTYFYIGDFGNNANGARTNLKIYRFPFSSIPSHTNNPVVTIPAAKIETINFTYSDQPQPPVASSVNTTKFDCEAMVIDGGNIHLFSKNWLNNNSTHYVINGTTAGNYVAKPVETLETGYLVTSASKTPNSKIIALLGYQVALPANHFLHLLSDFSNGKYFNGNKRKINLPNALSMGQAEGITFRNNAFGYISNEKLSTPLGTINSMLRSFSIHSIISPSVLPVEISNIKAFKKGFKVGLSWQSRAESNLERYDLEKSGTGQFEKVGTISATNVNSLTNHYEWTDETPYNGENYYRIKVVEKLGVTSLSEVVNINMAVNNKFSIYPNPVINGIININYRNLPKGNYSLNIYNTEGIRILKKTIDINTVGYLKTLSIPLNAPANMYFVTIANSTGTIEKQKFYIR